ncbi:hypothetical protein Vadar_000403 [Vaccinium darrowii]|uniref:Uncharacterized protein n=1 Tax=Vaccinium darrowii TaxID=229202 RepID=A0ACB7YII7_9ERIC|nr:hypothetical protein Vadar_000403 [Vaccinium darrowii]
MVGLGKFILTHYPSFSIKILITHPPYNAGSTGPYMNSVSATTSSITFHQLPQISSPLDISSPHHETLAFELLRLNNPNVLHAIESISNTCMVHALIMDLFCCPDLSVAMDLNISAYFFFPSGAACLASILYMPFLHRNTNKSFKDLKTILDIPGMPPIPSTDMPKPTLERNEEVYEDFLNASIQLPKSAGIIVNTFESLEPRANKAILEVEQLKEIAVGLERSGQRFLWVVRSPPSKDQTKQFLAPQSLICMIYSPKVFWTERKTGLVVKSWVLQVAVLNHGLVAGFVTHCGWNSALEAVCAGVPMVALPLYVEQRFNRVEEMNLALPMKESEDGFVRAKEVEKRVCELMNSEEGNLVRMQALKMKAAAEAAMSDGWSSRVALSKLVESWTRGRDKLHETVKL